jgi:hypothetical protein
LKLGPVFEAGDDLAGEVAVGLAAEEAQDIGTLEVQGGVPDEGGVEGRERLGGREQDVRRPLGLVGRPVIGHGPRLEDLGVERVEPARQGGEGPRPVGGELLGHQALGELRVAEVGEALVVALEVGVAPALQLMGQPLAAVEPDLDVEGEPGLEAGAEEAEDRVPVVFVEVQALPAPPAQAALGGVRGAVVLEAHAGLDALEGTDQAFRERMLGEQAAGELLFVDRTGLEVADGAVVLDRLAEHGHLEAFAGGRDILLEVEEADVGPLQEAEHAAGHHERQERAAEHEAVEPGQHGGDVGAVAGEESGHGLVLGVERLSPGRPVGRAPRAAAG